MLTRDEFIPLAQAYMDMVFRLAFSYLKNKADADDVTQNVLLSLYRTDTVFESRDNVRYWLVRVTLNECKKVWRSSWNRRVEFEDYTNTLTFEEPRYSQLFQAIMALEQKYRTVIVLHYYEGYTIAEMAAFLGLPQGTVGTRLRRARERLKRYLTEEA